MDTENKLTRPTLIYGTVMDYLMQIEYSII